jgi:N-acetylmuramoyl-L-alanine amidase
MASPVPEETPVSAGKPKQASASTDPCQPARPYALSDAVSPDFTYDLASNCPPQVADTSDEYAPGAPDAVDAISPNYNSRGGTKIIGIVLHNTESRFDQAVSWLRNPKSKVSAHIVINREGKVSRLVSDESNAWHALQANKSTLGIEIEAWKAGQGLDKAQEISLVRQVRYWVEKYGITAENIKPHRFHVNTDCPIYIWPTDSEFNDWKAKILKK